MSQSEEELTLVKKVIKWKDAGYDVVLTPQAIFVIDWEPEHRKPNDRLFLEGCDVISWEDAGSRPTSEEITTRVLRAGNPNPKPPVLMVDIGYPGGRRFIVGDKKRNAVGGAMKVAGVALSAEAYDAKKKNSVGDIEKHWWDVFFMRKRPPSRRDFLKRSAVAGALIASSELVAPLTRITPGLKRVWGSIEKQWATRFSIDGRSAYNAKALIDMAEHVRTELGLSRLPIIGVKMGQWHQSGFKAGFKELLKNRRRRKQILEEYRTEIESLKGTQKKPLIYGWDQKEGCYKWHSLYEWDPMEKKYKRIAKNQLWIKKLWIKRKGRLRRGERPR